MSTATPKSRSKSTGTKRKSLTPVRWNNTLETRDEINDKKRLALIRTAGSAFKARGFHKTSLDEVAAALNVTKPTLYYYVNGKEDLLFRCHQHALDLGEQAFEFAKEGTNGLDKLQRMLKRYIELMTDDFAAYSLLSDLNDLCEENKSIVQSRRRTFDTVFRGFVSDGIKDGSIRKCEPKIVVAWFMGAVNAIPRWFDAKGKMSGEEVANIYTDLVTKGLQA